MVQQDIIHLKFANRRVAGLTDAKRDLLAPHQSFLHGQHFSVARPMDFAAYQDISPLQFANSLVLELIDAEAEHLMFRQWPV